MISRGCSTLAINNNLTLLRYLKKGFNIPKDIFACLFSIHNTISLSCHEQVCLSGLQSFTFPDDGRSISRNVAHLNILVHDMINLLYYKRFQCLCMVSSMVDSHPLEIKYNNNRSCIENRISPNCMICPYQYMAVKM